MLLTLAGSSSLLEDIEVNHRKQSWLFVLMTLLLAAAVTGCNKKVQAPPPPAAPPPAKPASATINVSPTSIQKGESATLTWSTDNARTITLQGQPVAASGSQTVSPTQSTDYKLVAQGDAGTPDAGASARLTVSEPPPTPPPATRSATDEEIFAQGVHDIYFDYDKADLRSESQSALTQAAQVISQHPGWVVMIEGNCDERGSTEYNIGLGTSRASAAKDFLVKAGVNASQIQTRSNGKEKAADCKDEACWQKDRNDHLSLHH
jgi:peptidoglycan-associated lipoprotein